MPEASADGFHLSPQQRRLWGLQDDGRACRVQATLRLVGPLDPDRLRRALRTVTERHEILRTGLRPLPGMRVPLQYIGAEADPEIRRNDLGALDEPARRLAELARAEREEDVEVGDGRPLRALLVRLDSEEHALVLTLPALFADGPSLGTLVTDLGEAYAGSGPEDEELVQYADYAEWQREVLRDGDEAGFEFWRRQVSDGLLDAPLPFESAVVAEGRFASASVEVNGEAELAELAAAARSRGLDLEAAVLASWGILLGRLAGRDEVAVGALTDGRRLDPLRRTLGPVAKSVPLRIRHEPGTPFLETARPVEAALREAAERQESFRWEGMDGAAGGALLPAFEYLPAVAPVAADGLRLDLVDRHACGEPFALKLSCQASDGGLRLRLEYDPRRYGPAEADRLAGCLRAFLASAAARPDEAPERFALLAGTERAAMLRRHEGPVWEVRRGLSLPERFEAQAVETPDAVAVTSGGRSLTYRELERRTRRFAHRLRSLGVGPEAVVGICLERSPAFAEILLAVLRSGGAYVVLDPGLPEARLRHVLESARPRWIVADGSARLLPDGWADRVVAPPEGAAGPDEPPPLSGRPDPLGLAYLAYTSGSTGRPKGIATPHRGVASYLSYLLHQVGLGPDDAVLQVAAGAFDASVRDLLGPLTTGARTVVLTPSEAGDPVALLEAARRERVTAILSAVPTMVRGWLGAGKPEEPVELRTLLVSGETLYGNDCRRARDLFGAAVEVVNLYGPTECTMTSTWHRVATEPPEGAVVIGRPVGNAAAYVLDRGLEPVPPGVPGEIHLGGAGLTRGYVGRPAETAGRFLPDPAGGRPGGRLYRTGDLGRLGPGDELEFLGRTDDQVKLRGFRVELGEVASVLAEHPEVREAAAVLHGEDEVSRILVGYAVPRHGTSLPVARLQSYLEERLPGYMVPGAFVAVEEIPRTTSGKVDRRRLPGPGGERAAAEGEVVAPAGDLETRLAEIWCELLGLDRVGVTQSFFRLGGHSLLSTQLVGRVYEELGVEVRLRDFFDRPTIRDLARTIEELRSSSAAAPPPIPPAERGPSGAAPLSYSQQRLWFLDRLQPGNPAYHVGAGGTIVGPLAVPALWRAVDGVVRRHEALRTVFVEAGGGRQVRQEVLPRVPVDLPVVDLRGLDEARREQALQAVRRASLHEPFDLGRGPLLRAVLLRLGPERHAISVTLHHIVADGWSFQVFLRELWALYGGFVTGRPAELPDLAVQYADYAVWQRSWLTGETLEREVEFWKRALAGAPPALDLPTEHPRPRVQSSRGAAAELLLPERLSRRVRALAESRGVTLFMVSLAALGALFQRYTGQSDMVLGSPIAGRLRPEVQNLIGFFLNTLALRIDLSGDPTFEELLARVRETTVGAFGHQTVPFERILEELQPERDLSRTPVFQVMLNWLDDFGRPGRDQEVSGLLLEPLPSQDPVAKFDLELYGNEDGRGRIRYRTVYNRDLFGEDQVEGLHRHLARLLEEVASDPAVRLSSLRLETGPEGDAGAPRTETPVPSLGAADFPEEALESSIGERFEEQVRRHGERTAVSDGRERWSYERLGREVRRVAHGVVAEGAGDAPVGLLFAPGAPMVAALLGTLEAGRAYVPLDPTHPEERLRALLEDSGAALLLASGPELETARRLAADRAPEGCRVMDVAGLPEAPPGWAPAAVPPDALAYLLYTSGSSGRPKGVMQSHRNVLHHIRTYSHRLGISPEDRLSLLSSYGFDAGVMDLFGALLNGAALCLWNVKLRGVAGLADWLVEEGITVYHSTPTVFRLLADRLDGSRSFPDLRLVVLGGEEAHAGDLERFRRAFPGCLLVNGLGPSESTLALQAFFDAGSTVARHGLPVGHPVEGIEVELHNRAGRQVALWGTGEIRIRGRQVALGYWRQPELTERAFLPDPDGGGRRIYRTGDVGRLLPDGGIEFVGRSDDQIKIRGFRVEPGEVEAVLASHPAVREALVVPRSAPGSADAPPDRLVAWVVPKEGAAAPEPDELRAEVRRRVPEFMVPSSLVLLPELPSTANGKVDLAALPEPEWPSLTPGESFREPRGGLERTVAEVWQEVLGLERVGARDRFFDLGGHSLHLLEMQTLLAERLDRSVPLAELFNHPTVEALATYLDRPETGDEAVREVDARRDTLDAGKARRKHRLAARRRSTTLDVSDV